MERRAAIQALWETDRHQCLCELDRLLAEGSVEAVRATPVWAYLCRVYACQTEDPPIYGKVCELMHRHRRVLAEDYLCIPEEPSASRQDRRLMLRMAEPGIEADVLDVYRLLSGLRYPAAPEPDRGEEELLEMCVRRLQVEVEEQLVCGVDERWLLTSLQDEVLLGRTPVAYRREPGRVLVRVDGCEQAFEARALVGLHAVVAGLPVAMHMGKYMRLVRVEAVEQVYRRMMMSGQCTVIGCRLARPGLVRGVGQLAGGCTYLAFADPQGGLALLRTAGAAAEMVFADDLPNPRNLFEAAVNIIYRHLQ